MPPSSATESSTTPLLSPLTSESHWEHIGIVALESESEVDARYERIAEEVDDDFFSDAPKLPMRTPYLRGAMMGRGAAFYSTFRVRLISFIHHHRALFFINVPSYHPPSQYTSSRTAVSPFF